MASNIERVTELKLISKNTRPTSMRILVYDYLNVQTAALSLPEIEAHFHKADKVTIYRTLKTFEEKGIVHRIHDDNITKYKLCDEECSEQTHKDHHLHLYCKICKQTTCKKDISFPENIKYDFRIDEIQIFAKGICELCLVNGKHSKR